MRILVINPNSTKAMTRSIETAARAAAGGGSEITAVNPDETPPVIQGRDDGLAALPGLFRIFEELVPAGDYDACIVACFDDTGLMALKRRSPVPVIGIGEAAFHVAMLTSIRFSVITTLPVSVPVIETNLAMYGFGSRCAKVRASEVSVLELETAKEISSARIADEIIAALAEDEPEAIVLGCAGMADLANDLSLRFRLPVIDGVAAAVAMAKALHSCGADRWIAAGGNSHVA